jgi:hypothetical protein
METSTLRTLKKHFCRNILCSAIVLSIFVGGLVLTPTNGQAEATSISDVVGYKKGFYIISPDERFKLKIGGYVQGFFRYRALDANSDDNTFRVRRARLKLSGYIYSKVVQYVVEYDFSNSTLFTTVINLAYTPTFNFVIGQYKIPFNFESLTSASTLQFVDRSATHRFFGIANEREIGVGAHGKLNNSFVEYRLGIFNGEGINSQNTNKDVRFAGRLVFNLMGRHGTKFSDTGYSEEAHVAFGVGGMFNNTFNAAGTAEQKTSSLTGDISAKYLGTSFHGSIFWQNVNPIGPAANDLGYLVQAGYFLLPEFIEAAARISLIFPEGSANMHEYAGALNIFFFGNHNVKWATDYTLQHNVDAGGLGDDILHHIVRTMIQVKL